MRPGEDEGDAGPESLRPHTRAEREAVAHRPIPLWRRRFGDVMLNRGRVTAHLLNAGSSVVGSAASVLPC